MNRQGLSGTKEYNIWYAMKNRCENTAADSYHRYGGRGISVCDRWKNSFNAFYEDMGPRPSDKHSIDRADNDGDYEPSNCQWVTIDKQASNTRQNRNLTANGETYHLCEWARRLGVWPAVVSNRLRRGWSVEDAVLTPPDLYRKNRHGWEERK